MKANPANEKNTISTINVMLTTAFFVIITACSKPQSNNEPGIKLPPDTPPPIMDTNQNPDIKPVNSFKNNTTSTVIKGSEANQYLVLPPPLVSEFYTKDIKDKYPRECENLASSLSI